MEEKIDQEKKLILQKDRKQQEYEQNEQQIDFFINTQKGLDEEEKTIRQTQLIRLEQKNRRLIQDIKNLEYQILEEQQKKVIEQRKKRIVKKIFCLIVFVFILVVFFIFYIKQKRAEKFKAEAEIIERQIKKQQESEKLIAKLDKSIAEKDRSIAETDKSIAEIDKSIAEKDRSIAEKDKSIAKIRKEREQNEKD